MTQHLEFVNTRTRIEDNLQPYTSSVEPEPHFAVPEKFRIWVLEWPAHASLSIDGLDYVRDYVRCIRMSSRTLSSMGSIPTVELLRGYLYYLGYWEDERLILKRIDKGWLCRCYPRDCPLS